MNAKLSDIIHDDKHLETVFRLVENRYWTALRQYLNREGVIADEKILPDYVFYCLKKTVEDYKVKESESRYVCCFCCDTCIGFGNNPAPINNDPARSCCDSCNEEVVIPARIKEVRLRVESESPLSIEIDTDKKE